MDEFDFEELITDMLGITDEERDKNPDIVNDKFYLEFYMDLEYGYKLTKRLIEHTIPVKAGLSHKMYHAFVSKNQPVMLMKIESK